MKHPVLDRLLMLLCAACALCGTAAIVALLVGVISLEGIVGYINQFGLMMSDTKVKIVMIAAAAVLVVIALLLLSAILPAKKKRSSTFAIQRNENGMVRISLKALETLVQKCLNQHAELKVVTSSLFSDEESVRVDVHINMQTDISMPLAISALQKQIKKYLEACSGVVIQEVRIFVEGTIPATEDTANSPYALPASILGTDSEALPLAQEEAVVIEAAQEEPAEQPADEQPTQEEAPVQENAAEEAEQAPAQEESAVQVTAEETNEENMGE